MIFRRSIPLERDRFSHHRVNTGKNLSQTINQLLLIFYMCLIILKKIKHTYKSKYNLTRENQVILLMVPDGEKWHYLP